MKKIKYIFIYLLLINSIFAENVFSYFNEDINGFYTKDNGEKFVYIFLVGSLMANSPIDQSIRDLYQTKIRDTNSNNQAKIAKQFGEGDIMIPLMFIFNGAGSLLENNELQNFGSKTLRTYLVGAPLMLLMQKVTGGSRPDEMDKASHWKFFKDENGVSGHAFMGSIPFLVLSKMSDNSYMSEAFKGISVCTALSRINDDAHYPSQALLGWYMGKMAVDSVFSEDLSNSTDKQSLFFSLAGNFIGFSLFQELSSGLWEKKNILLLPIVDEESYGVFFSKKF